MKLIVVFIVFGEVFGLQSIHRSKRFGRFTVFPPTSPTRIQLIAGIGIPVALEYESVTFGYTFKAEYFLADNTTLINQFSRDPFNPITRPISFRRRRHVLLAAVNEQMQKQTYDPIEIETDEERKMENVSNDHYEQYDVEAIEIDAGLTGTEDDEFYADENNGDYGKETLDENGDDEQQDEETHPASHYSNSNSHLKDHSTARWTLFKGIEMLAQRKGLAGRPCMLRSICESVQAPFSIKSGILGELMHIIMTPSVTNDTVIEHTQNEYLRAEEIGRSGAPCDKVFKECTKSVLDQFSGIYSTVENLIKIFG